MVKATHETGRKERRDSSTEARHNVRNNERLSGDRIVTGRNKASNAHETEREERDGKNKTQVSHEHGGRVGEAPWPTTCHLQLCRGSQQHEPLRPAKRRSTRRAHIIPVRRGQTPQRMPNKAIPRIARPAHSHSKSAGRSLWCDVPACMVRQRPRCKGEMKRLNEALDSVSAAACGDDLDRNRERGPCRSHHPPSTPSWCPCSGCSVVSAETPKDLFVTSMCQRNIAHGRVASGLRHLKQVTRYSHGITDVGAVCIPQW